MDELLTVAEVVTILQVSDQTVRRWMKDGTLEAIALPHLNTRTQYRIKRETVDRILDEQQKQKGVS